MVYHILDMIKTIIFDWKRTLYDPDTGVLIEGALDFLEYLKNKNIPMVLIGKGGEDMNEEVDRLGVRYYFKQAGGNNDLGKTGKICQRRA